MGYWICRKPCPEVEAPLKCNLIAAQNSELIQSKSPVIVLQKWLLGAHFIQSKARD